MSDMLKRGIDWQTDNYLPTYLEIGAPGHRHVVSIIAFASSAAGWAIH